jgi:putative membrane protein
MAMLLFVLGSGALYEIFEWLLAVSMDPVSSEAYNGQQGDPFDAQKDMLIASIGSLAGLAFAYRRKVAVLDRLASIRTMTPTDVAITPGQTLVREDHDR